MAATLLRRQYYVTSDNVTKVHAIAEKQGVADAEIVRRAIDAYDETADDEQLLNSMVDLMLESVNDAIKAVDETCASLEKTNAEYQAKWGDE